MENIMNLQISDVMTEKKAGTKINGKKHSPEKTKSNPVIDNKFTEGDENFFNYLHYIGLANEPNLLVLPSKNHYYYDNNDLKGVTTLINLKKLNMIKHLDSFLNTVYHVLSPETNFIGCFSDKKTQTDIGWSSRMYKRFINFLDSRIDFEIDKKDVSGLLESNGFKVIDMTEINGLTYFRTRNNGRSVNKSFVS